MVLQDTVSVFKILEGTIINDNQRQMVLTLASDLSLKSMKGAQKQEEEKLFWRKILNEHFE